MGFTDFDSNCDGDTTDPGEQVTCLWDGFVCACPAGFVTVANKCCPAGSDAALGPSGQCKAVSPVDFVVAEEVLNASGDSGLDPYLALFSIPRPKNPNGLFSEIPPVPEGDGLGPYTPDPQPAPGPQILIEQQPPTAESDGLGPC